MPKNKINKKINKPYYMNDFGEIKQNNGENNIKPNIIKKFQLGIDKNNNPIITIDNTMHFMTCAQFNAFTIGILNINKKINPEVDYTKNIK